MLFPKRSFSETSSPVWAVTHLVASCSVVANGGPVVLTQESKTVGWCSLRPLPAPHYAALSNRVGRHGDCGRHAGSCLDTALLIEEKERSPSPFWEDLVYTVDVSTVLPKTPKNSWFLPP